MSQRTRAAARIKARALVAEYLEQLRRVSAEGAQELEQLRKESSESARAKTVERDWRREAQEAGLSPQEIEESWTWFRRYLFEKPEQQAARGTVPESVRRVLRHNPLQWIDYAPDPAFWAAVGVQYWPRGRHNEQDWRRDARAAGLSEQEIEDSWVWFRRYAFEAPPVLEETEQQAARQTTTTYWTMSTRTRSRTSCCPTHRSGASGMISDTR